VEGIVEAMHRGDTIITAGERRALWTGG